MRIYTEYRNGILFVRLKGNLTKNNVNILNRKVACRKVVAFCITKYIDKNAKISFIATIIIGCIAHLYKFTNNLPHFDTLNNFYSDQNVIGSGRWFLSIACAMSSFF